MLAEVVGLGEQVVGASGGFFIGVSRDEALWIWEGWEFLGVGEGCDTGGSLQPVVGGLKASQGLKATAPGMEWRSGGGPSGTGGQGHDTLMIWFLKQAHNMIHK